MLKAFSGLIKIPYARRLGFKTKISDYFSKIMKIFSYYYRVCHSCLVVLSISGLRIESVGCHFRKPANQSFPGIFLLNCPASSFIFCRVYRPGAVIVASICPFPVLMPLLMRLQFSPQFLEGLLYAFQVYLDF